MPSISVMGSSLPTHDNGKASPDKNDLTDHEIHQLLLEAEGRLRTPVSKALDNVADSSNISELSLDPSVRPYISQQPDITTGDAVRIVTASGSKPANREPSKIMPSKSLVPAKDKPTAGSDWFNLPKTELTPELKRDLQLLRMRSILDPKRHYKKESKKAQLPEFSQVGTVIESPTEFFSARIANKDRKKNFIDETLAVERQTKRLEAKYKDVQSTKQSGKKAFYRGLKDKRRSRRG